MLPSNAFALITSPHQSAHGHHRSSSTRAFSMLALTLQPWHSFLLFPSPSPCLNA